MNEFETHSISVEAALGLVAAAQRAAGAAGAAVSVCVCDSEGRTKAFARMDGAVFGTIAFAENKAYSAAMFRTPTNAWHGILETSAPLRQGLLGSLDRFTTMAGGIPLTVGEHVVGAIGVSGGSIEQDHEFGETAVREVLG